MFCRTAVASSPPPPDYAIKPTCGRSGGGWNGRKTLGAPDSIESRSSPARRSAWSTPSGGPQWTGRSVGKRKSGPASQNSPGVPGAGPSGGRAVGRRRSIHRFPGRGFHRHCRVSLVRGLEPRRPGGVSRAVFGHGAMERSPGVFGHLRPPRPRGPAAQTDFPKGAKAPNTTPWTPLWFVRAVQAYHRATHDDDRVRAWLPVMREIVDSYQHGNQYDIRMDQDGLIEIPAGGSAAHLDGRSRRRQARHPAGTENPWKFRPCGTTPFNSWWRSS